MKVKATYRLDKELVDRIASTSAIEGRTHTWYVSTALNQYFDKPTGIVSVSEKKPVASKAVVVETIDYSILNLSHCYLDEIQRIRTKNASSAKTAKMTQRIVNALAKEFGKSYALGFTIDQILDEWESRGWKSFKAEWMRPDRQNGQVIDHDSTRTRDQPVKKQLSNKSWAD